MEAHPLRSCREGACQVRANALGRQTHPEFSVAYDPPAVAPPWLGWMDLIRRDPQTYAIICQRLGCNGPFLWLPRKGRKAWRKNQTMVTRLSFREHRGPSYSPTLPSQGNSVTLCP